MHAAREDFEQAALPLLDALYGVAVRLTRDKVDAEDLVQDTLCRAYRFWSTFRPGTSVRAWLFAILRNTFITSYHRTVRRMDFFRELSSQAAGCGSSAGQPAYRPPLPDTALAVTAMRERIMGALDALPEDHRMAVILADLEGLSYREIAEVMSCPIGTVMSRIHRGRQRLYQSLCELDVGSTTATGDPGGVDPPAEAVGALSIAARRARKK